MEKCSLFDNGRKDADPIYLSLQDPKNCGAEKARLRCEDLWRDFSTYADNNFFRDFPKHFCQRWFEMYLTASFIRRGIEIKCPKPGPDICAVVDGKQGWVEAVCPQPGKSCKKDSVPELVPNTAQEVPFDQYALRLRNALDTKQKKYWKYLEKGIVQEDDIKVIAISASGIPFLRFNMEEAILRTLYGLGDKCFFIDKLTKEYAGSGRMRKRKIDKSSRNTVDVVPFLDSRMEHVTAVIGSSADTTTDLRDIGQDCVVYRNLTAKSPWDTSSLPWMRWHEIDARGENDIDWDP